ncbi:acyl carrier protein [Neorhizobium sp. P12A]|jgi:acyl carrier protein|nr:acyl carrier protein [Neorhizobium sp. P12A]TCR73235.1 acyl carrier protein [Rhizobium sp. BK376]
MIPLKEQIRAFIVESFLFGDTSRALGDDASLIESDVVDSTGILELVSFVEDNFGVTVADAEILPANFDSITKVATFIMSKRSAADPIAAVA